MAGKGGKTEGAGRKPGSRNALTKQLLRDAVTESDQKAILKKGIELAKNGDKDLIKFYLEHFHGKVPTDLNVSHTFEKLLEELENEEQQNER